MPASTLTTVELSNRGSSFLSATPATVPLYLPLVAQPRDAVKASASTATAPTTRELPDLLTLDRASSGKPIGVTVVEIERLPAVIRAANLDWQPLSPATIAAAKSFILGFWFVVNAQLGTWQSPHVASDGTGEVTFEWWHSSHSLTFFVGPDQAISNLTAWGLHMWDEMDEGENPTSQELVEIWSWLQDGK
jgi:hypothetical protein